MPSKNMVGCACAVQGIVPDHSEVFFLSVTSGFVQGLFHKSTCDKEVSFFLNKKCTWQFSSVHSPIPRQLLLVSFYYGVVFRRHAVRSDSTQVTVNITPHRGNTYNYSDCTQCIIPQSGPTSSSLQPNIWANNINTLTLWSTSKIRHM